MLSAKVLGLQLHAGPPRVGSKHPILTTKGSTGKKLLKAAHSPRKANQRSDFPVSHAGRCPSTDRFHRSIVHIERDDAQQPYPSVMQNQLRDARAAK